MAKQSRPDRWAAAVSKAQSELADLRAKVELLDDPLGKLATAMADLQAIQEEYAEWQGNLPENLQSSDTYERLEAVTSLEIDSYTELDSTSLDSLDEIANVLEECESADLPKGFGRD